MSCEGSNRSTRRSTSCRRKLHSYDTDALVVYGLCRLAGSCDSRCHVRLLARRSGQLVAHAWPRRWCLNIAGRLRLRLGQGKVWHRVGFLADLRNVCTDNLVLLTAAETAARDVVNEHEKDKRGDKRPAEARARVCQLVAQLDKVCLLYTSPSPRDRQKSRMPSSA